MFSLATGIYQSYFAPPKLSILIIGLDGSGKTSLLERIKVTDIYTRLDEDVKAATTPASYAKGAVAVASVGRNNDAIEIEDGQQQQHRRQPQRGGHHQEGGKPARLPPPLPPKQALKSRLSVEKMLEDGFSSATTETKEKENGVADEAVNILLFVPPPPLVANRNPDVMDNTSKEANKKKASANVKPSKSTMKKPLLPPRHDSITKKMTLTPVPERPTKQNSFIQLLRCPSPGRYSDATQGEEEDEEYHDNPAKDASESWSTEYLEDYYINYHEGEEFDIKQQRVAGGGNTKKMFPMDRIRPTLGQNLARLDMCGCKCTVFDLSGAGKMRPLWERYYRDTDAIIYVVNAADTSLTSLLQSRHAFEKMCQNDALSRRVKAGLPILIFANQLDVAYKEYGDGMEKLYNEKNGRGISWNDDEEDDFVGGTIPLTANEDEEGSGAVSKRVVDFHDLAELFGFPQTPSLGDGDGQSIDSIAPAGPGNVFLFGGSAKSGEGVRAAMEYLVAHAKSYHLGKHARRS